MPVMNDALFTPSGLCPTVCLYQTATLVAYPANETSAYDVWLPALSEIELALRTTKDDRQSSISGIKDHVGVINRNCPSSASTLIGPSLERAVWLRRRRLPVPELTFSGRWRRKGVRSGSEAEVMLTCRRVADVQVSAGRGFWAYYTAILKKTLER